MSGYAERENSNY